MNTTEYVVVGKIGGTFGVHGWVKLFSYTEQKDDIFGFAPWYLKEKEHWQIIEVTSNREHGKGMVVKFLGYDTPEQAQLLVGKTISVDRSQLPVLKKGEYYWSDLEGLEVINQEGESLGKVVYLIETGSNDVLIVKKDKEYGIPYLQDTVIKEVDLVKRVIYVDWKIIE